MTRSFLKTTRTTNMVEETMRGVDKALMKCLECPEILWRHRDIFTSRVEEGERTHGFRNAVCFAETQFVKIKGETDEGHEITAIAKFSGIFHEMDSAFDGETADYSESLELEEISLEITTAAAQKISETVHLQRYGC